MVPLRTVTSWVLFSKFFSVRGNRFRGLGVARVMNRTGSSPDDASFLVRCILFGVVFVASCWPYFIWHGTDRYGRMVWDASSWAACFLWWMGVILVTGIVVVLVKANSPCARFAEQQEREERELQRLKARFRELQREQFRQDEDLRAHALREEQWL